MALWLRLSHLMIYMSYGDADNDEQMNWENDLKPPQEVLPKENVWPKEELDLTNRQLIFLC